MQYVVEFQGAKSIFHSVGLHYCLIQLEREVLNTGEGVNGGGETGSCQSFIYIYSIE